MNINVKILYIKVQIISKYKILKIKKNLKTGAKVREEEIEVAGGRGVRRGREAEA